MQPLAETDLPFQLVDSSQSPWSNVGYLPNAVKMFLVVKPETTQEAEDIFKETGVNICTAGQHYLGGAIGSKKFATEFIAEKVTEWVVQLDRLAKFVQSQPHAVFRP